MPFLNFIISLKKKVIRVLRLCVVIDRLIVANQGYLRMRRKIIFRSIVAQIYANFL